MLKPSLTNPLLTLWWWLNVYPSITFKETERRFRRWTTQEEFVFHLLSHLLLKFKKIEINVSKERQGMTETLTKWRRRKWRHLRWYLYGLTLSLSILAGSILMGLSTSVNVFLGMAILCYGSVGLWAAIGFIPPCPSNIPENVRILMDSIYYFMGYGIDLVGINSEEDLRKRVEIRYTELAKNKIDAEKLNPVPKKARDEIAKFELDHQRLCGFGLMTAQRRSEIFKSLRS